MPPLVMAAAAAAAGRIRLHAVTTVAGNVPLARTTRNALVTLELAGAGSVPVHEGCDRPVVREAATAQHVHGPGPLAMAVALRPDLVTDAETASVRVVLGDEARGQLLVDRRQLAAAPNVTLVRRVNANGFRALFEACAITPGTAERLRPVMGAA